MRLIHTPVESMITNENTRANKKRPIERIETSSEEDQWNRTRERTPRKLRTVTKRIETEKKDSDQLDEKKVKLISNIKVEKYLENLKKIPENSTKKINPKEVKESQDSEKEKYVKTEQTYNNSQQKTRGAPKKIVREEFLEKKEKVQDGIIKFFEIKVIQNRFTKEKFNINKRNNYINIFRFFREDIKEIESIKMINKTTAEIRTRREEACRCIFNKYENTEKEKFKMYIPRRAEERWGVIKEWSHSLKELEEEIEEGQNVIGLERLKKRTKVENGFEWQETMMILVKFGGCNLPTKLMIMEGMLALNVVPYIKSVKQCFNCFRFGHTKKWCRESEKKCLRCGENFHGDCLKETKCINCGGNHTALDRSCGFSQLEIATNKIMAYKNLSFQEARSTARIELGMVEEGNSYEQRENGNYKLTYNSKEFPPLGRNRRQTQKVEMWEDQPVHIRRNEWNVWSSRRPIRNIERKEQKIEVSNRFETLYNGTKNREQSYQVRDSDVEENIPEKNQRPEILRKNKGNKHAVSDDDLEELLEWIKELNLVEALKKKLWGENSRPDTRNFQSDSGWRKQYTNLPKHSGRAEKTEILENEVNWYEIENYRRRREFLNRARKQHTRRDFQGEVKSVLTRNAQERRENIEIPHCSTSTQNYDKQYEHRTYENRRSKERFRQETATPWTIQNNNQPHMEDWEDEVRTTEKKEVTSVHNKQEETKPKVIDIDEVGANEEISGPSLFESAEESEVKSTSDKEEENFPALPTEEVYNLEEETETITETK